MTATEPRPEPPPPDEGSGQASEPEPSDDATAADATTADAMAAAPLVGRVRHEQAREDTDAAWGEYRDSNDERLYRDRPPHWADF